MYANVRDLYESRPIQKARHPEAPKAGDELLYVDLSREKLEELYKTK